MTTTKTWTSQEIRYWKTEASDHYHGTREALIEAKLARPEWFAQLGELERSGRRLVRHWRFDERKVLLRWTRPNWFGLTLPVDQEEKNRRRALGLPPGWHCVRIRLKPLRAARSDAAFQRFMVRAIGVRTE